MADLEKEESPPSGGYTKRGVASIRQEDPSTGWLGGVVVRASD